jgi:hypothetical protein
MDLRKAITWKMVAFSLLVLIAGIGVMYWAEQDAWWKGHELWRAVVREIGAMFFTTVAVALVWELAGRHELVDEVFEIAGISEQLKNAGVVGASKEPHSGVKWEECFAGSRTLDVLIGWDFSISEAVREKIAALAQRSGTQIRIILPKPSSIPSLEGLRKKYDQSALKQLGADVRIGEFNAKHCLYVFDRYAVIVLIRNGQDVPGPAIVTKEVGSLWEFARNEFDEAFQKTTPLASYAVKP